MFNWTRHIGKSPTSGSGPQAENDAKHQHYMYMDSGPPQRFGDFAMLVLFVVN